LGFAGEGESIEVKPCTLANLPASLTGSAVVWISSDQGATSAYHLLDPKDPQHSSAVEYINNQWYYLTWADSKYYTTPRARVPTSFHLGIDPPSAESLRFSKEATKSTSESSSAKSLEEVELGQRYQSRDQDSTRQSREAFVFGFNDEAILPSTMATVTLQNTTVSLELAHGEDTEMYRTTFCSGAGGQQSRDDGEGILLGGGGPLSGHPGQPYLREGPYSGPPGGLPGGGGGPPMGGSGNQNVGPAPQASPQSTSANGSLKGTVLTIFDGNRKNTKQFTQEFTIYRMINQDSPTMWNAYTRTALALSFMRGPAINDWALQQTEGLYTKCNGDPLNGIAPMYRMDDERIWVEFGHEF
jgi:hypothetical protein